MQLPEAAAARASAALDARRNDLMSRPSVIGVGVGQSESNLDEAVIIVYVDRTTGVRPTLPNTINGIPVRRVETDPFVAY
jgi:hypothetical protein